MRKNLTLGLFGFGCVGQGLYHVLEESQGIKAVIKKICVKDPTKKRPLDASLFTFNKADILNNPDINVVVELIDDADAAYEIVKTALLNGKHVVTANKKMLAEHLQEIYDLQEQCQRSVLYEGAVCGSIPILRNLEEYYDNDLIKSVEGIFNGSTNYILTKVFEENKSYESALKQAQDLGFAESDPRLDVEGYDPKYKLVLAIAHTYGLFVKPDDVVNIGIDKIKETDLAYARSHKWNIKLVAKAFKNGNSVYGFVIPQFVQESNPLFPIRNEYNAVTVEGAFAEKQLFVGKGAGSYPTGSAVLSDVSALTYDYMYEYKRHHREHDVTFSKDLILDAYISFSPENTPQQDLFHYISKSSTGFISGQISLRNLALLSQESDISIILNPVAD